MDPSLMHRRPLAYAEAHGEEILQELVAFASIPSVSTDPAYKAHIGSGLGMGRRAHAPARASRMSTINPDRRPSHRHQRLAARAGRADDPGLRPLRRAAARPAGEMEEPALRAGGARRRLYARGVSDDKGPMLIPLKTAEAFMQTARPAADQCEARDRGRGGAAAAPISANSCAPMPTSSPPISCSRPTAPCGGPTSPR